MPMTHEEVELIATRAAEKAADAAVEAALKRMVLSSADVELLVSKTVRETLTQIGIDHTNPWEMQQDFQHLRSWRRSGQELQSKGILIILGIFLTGIVGFISVGLKDWFGK